MAAIVFMTESVRKSVRHVKPQRNEYPVTAFSEVVAPPVGATVPYLPEEAEEQTVAGKTYFAYEDTYYKPFASDGETIYMVVEDPHA